MEGDCRAPWLPSPAPLSAAILVSNDGGGREARELPAWVQRAFMQEQRDSPVGCDAQPAPRPSPASTAGTPYPHCSVIHRGVSATLLHQEQDMGTLARGIPCAYWHHPGTDPHELAVSQDGSSKPSNSCGTPHQDCPHWHCSPTSDVSTPWGATAVCQHREFQ